MNVFDLAQKSALSPFRFVASKLQAEARKQMLARLPAMNHVRLRVVEQPSGEQHWFGPEMAPTITVTIKDFAAYSYITFGGSAGAGESYFLGLWDCDDLTALIRAMVGTNGILEEIDTRFSRVTQQMYSVSHKLKGNSKTGGRKNIQAHYDLGNDFFEAFLDSKMLYSCAVFATADTDLEDAQTEKIDRICRKINLQADDELLEIGTGWGAFAIHAAREYGCRVTTTTISDEQYALAAERIAAAGLQDRITLLKEDYRDVTGQYDKLVSIEMIEAVGDRYLDGFFEQCGKLLKPDGLMLLQAITSRDQNYKTYLKRVDFIQRFVFPGGCLPSLARMSGCITNNTDMTLLHQEDLAPHYALTLKLWRERLFRKQAELQAAGYTEVQLRLWEFYLASCEAGFSERGTGLVQMLYMKPEARPAAFLPDHMAIGNEELVA